MKTIHLEKCTSTNDVAKEILNNNDVPPVLIIAEKQTKGRGRTGSWWSPEGVGLYMSVIRELNGHIPHYFTNAVGISLTVLFHQYFYLLVHQHGVNDIYLANKKLAGILCEVHPQTNKLIIGIGINLFRPVKIRKDLVDKIVYLNDYASEYRIDKFKLVEMIAEEILKI